MKFLIPFSLLISLLTSAPGFAAPQTADPSVHLPAYDVASIKPGKTDGGSTLLFRLDGFTANGLPLKFLVKQAYGIEDDQIARAPNWINSETYDIEAKIDGPNAAELEKLSDDQRKLMLQSFLADRFKLTVHWETKQLPVLALVIAKNGPKLQEAKPGDSYPNGIKGPDGNPAGHAGMMMWGRDHLTGQGIPMASLVPPLTQELGRIVQDKTGLTGKYDIELRWTADDAGPDSRPASDTSAPSLFTAIQEQLGLKLDSQRSPVDVLVIDHVERPPAN